MPHGSVIELDESGAPRRWLDPDGAVLAEIEPALVRLFLPGALEVPLTVEPAAAHPVLGAVHALAVGGPTLAHVAAVDWRRPARIPAIDAPGRIPGGAGTVLLNVLALGARAAGRTLRYAGPYPTAALWASLATCFRAPAGADVSAFTEGALERAVRGDDAPLPIDFTPAPFERVRVAPRVVVHLRDGVERLYLGGVAWLADLAGAGARRLAPDDGGYRVELWLADTAWAEVARLDARGQLIDGPHPLPPVLSSVMGKPFPPALVGALTELIAEHEPPLLAVAMREVARELPMVWGDPGADAARLLAGVLVVHAGLWERLGAGASSLAPLAITIAQAVATPIKVLAQQRLETVPVGVALN